MDYLFGFYQNYVNYLFGFYQKVADYLFVNTEIDYLLTLQSRIVPMEVKAGVQGGMKSLWEFMRQKKLSQAVRCSLENFGSFDYVDEKDNKSVRNVIICPLYAVSQLQRLMNKENNCISF